MKRNVNFKVIYLEGAIQFLESLDEKVRNKIAI